MIRQYVEADSYRVADVSDVGSSFETHSAKEEARAPRPHRDVYFASTGKTSL